MHTSSSCTGPALTTAALVFNCMVVLALSGCDRAGSKAGSGVTSIGGIRQTGFPGQVSAGGETSGRIIARAAKNASSGVVAGSASPAAGSTQAPQEGTRGQSPTGSVAGTPGIPEGSGGTTSGAEMGGTTPSAAATRAAPAPGGAAPTVPSQEHRK